MMLSACGRRPKGIQTVAAGQRNLQEERNRGAEYNQPYELHVLIARSRRQMVDQRNGRAVVLGGSVAGSVAARLLAPAYDTVTVVDRDDLCGPVAPRAAA